jgi:hypothetical protein
VRSVDGTYSEIFPPGENSRFVDFAVAERAPIVFGSFVEGGDRNNRTHLCSSSAGAHPFERLDLVDSKCELRRVWVSKLLSASADATTLYVILGSAPPHSAGTPYAARYFVAAVSVGDGSFEDLAELETPYA